MLSLAVEGLYRPLWSEVILAELENEEQKKLEDRIHLPVVEATARATHLIGEMRRAFEDAIVLDWEALEGSYGLPDRNDEHVVAAACVGGAGAIVTYNVKDFPSDRVPDSIQVLLPKEFLLNTVSVDPMRSLMAVAEMARRRGGRDPKYTVDWILRELERRYSLESVVDLLREA